MDLHPSRDHLWISSESLYAQGGDVRTGSDVVDRTESEYHQTEVAEASEPPEAGFE